MEDRVDGWDRDVAFLTQKLPRWSPVKVTRWRGLLLTIMLMFAAVGGAVWQQGRDRASARRGVCDGIEALVQGFVGVAGGDTTQAQVDDFTNALNARMSALGCHIHVTIGESP